MSLPRFRMRTLILVAGIAIWLLVAGAYARTILAYIVLIPISLLLDDVNTIGRMGDDPTQLQVILLIALLAAAPFVLIGIHFAPIWREPRPLIIRRFRVRTLMIAVACVGILLGGCMGLYRRSESFERLASYHGQACHQLYESLGPLSETNTTVELIRIMKSRGPKEAQTLEAAFYHDLMERKYAVAARYPWFPVPPDPPEPE